MDTQKKLIAEWVADGLRQEGKSQTGLGRALGITQPNVFRILRGERSLRAEEIPVVAKYLDRPFPWAQTSVLAGATTALTEGQMPVLGRVQAGAWMADDGSIDETIGAIPFGRDTAYPPTREQYAVQIVGDSMDRILPEGSYAIVLAADGATPVHGDLVIVRRVNNGLIERTVKRFVEVDGGQLVPESTNPRHLPIALSAPAEGVTIEIEGFVIGRYQRLGR